MLSSAHDAGSPGRSKTDGYLYGYARSPSPSTVAKHVERDWLDKRELPGRRTERLWFVKRSKVDKRVDDGKAAGAPRVSE
jgi:hypothetical protein